MAYDQRSLDDYVDVAERITEFRDKHPDGTLQPADLERPWHLIQAQGIDKNGEVVQQTFIVYVAAAYRSPDDPRPGIGAAWEVFPGRTPYTRGSELMNAETSAWGRAIIAVGAADAKRGVASRQEVAAARAQRNAPPEVDRDGAATVAEQSRMWHGHEPGTERLRSVPVDDEFYDQAEERPGSILPQQKTRMFAMFNGVLKMRLKDEQLGFINDLLGTGLASRDQLSVVQAGRVLAALEERSRADA